MKQTELLSAFLKNLLTITLLLVFGLPWTAAAPLYAQEEPRTAQAVQVSPYLRAQLDSTTGPVSFLVLLRDQPAPDALLARTGLRNGGHLAKATLLYQELTTLAQRTQAPLRAWLDAQGIRYRAFYLVNMLEVEGDLKVVTALQQRPEVGRLVANPRIDQGFQSLPQPPRFTLLAATEAKASLEIPYGLVNTHAADLWALGDTGQGIVIASQDTGVEWDHPALRAAYRGVITSTTTTTVTHVYNWYDAWGVDGRPSRCDQDPQIPCDDQGHGTHTVGTMVGDATKLNDTVLGMAPGAKWIGCRNMRQGVGTPASYTACFEFFLAPYPQGGNPFTDGHPELAPNIINNSWGCPPSEGCDTESLRQVVETMRAAGQMVVASAGNKGSSCNTVVDPIAIYDAVFSVGAHDREGKIASFSSRGTVTIDGSGRMKPDISAPGVAVRSTWVNKGYNTIQGTSMASPHVAGAVALLWSAVPALIGNIDLTAQVLIKSATPVPFNQCKEGATPVVPNNTYGYGLLNALAAVQMAQQPATVTVRVTDEQVAVQPGVSVALVDQLTGYRYTEETIFNGIARFPTVYSGAYTVEITDPVLSTQGVTVGAGTQNQVELERITMAERVYLPLVIQ
ncbi:MAG: S8 family serine peptidase [Caldilineaceae bacterium]